MKVVLKFPTVPYQKGWDQDFETMTVADMIATLQKHDPDMPVFATWEGQLIGFREDALEVSDWGGNYLTWDVE